MHALILTLIACSTPEEDAEVAGLAYLRAQLTQDLPTAHSKVCAAEREAKPLSELLEARSALDHAGLLGAAAKEMAEKLAKEGRIAVTATTLDEGKAVGTLHYDMFIGEEKTGSNTLDLRLEEGTWCAVPGWVVEKQAISLDANVKSTYETATQAAKEVRPDEAIAALETLQEAAAAVPEHAWLPLTKKTLEDMPAALDALRDMKRRNVGGRWLVDESTDPMTDQRSVTAQLASTNGVESYGREEAGALYVRCSRGSLDVFVATPFILESDWRYDSVPGQYRFGTEPAERLRANKSKDSKAAFLRGARAWTQRLVEHQAEKWTVELSPHNKLPQAFFFDLTAADKAMAQVWEACPPR